MSKGESSSVRQPGEGGRRRSSRRRRALAWGSILALLLLLVFASKPAYHRLKTYRADQLAAAGEKLARAAKWEEAAAKYRVALELDPFGYRSLEGAARLATQLGRPEAIDLWAEVVKLPQATISDRQEYAKVLVTDGRFKVAAKVIEGLLKDDPDSKTLEIASNYSRKIGDHFKAVQFARLAVKRSPSDEFARVQLAELLAESTDKADRDEARKLLWELAGEEGPYHQLSVEALAGAPELSAGEQSRVLQLLEALSPPNMKDSLLAFDLRLQLHPEDAQKLYDQATARWNAGQTRELIDLARWLNLHQQPERVLSLFSIERALGDNQLLLARLDALALLQRWEDIDNLLSDPDLSLDPSVLESFRARTAQERGAVLDAELHWNHALSFATHDPAKLRFVANFAEQSQASATALKAYEQLAKFPEQAAFAYSGTERMSARVGDLSVQRAAAAKISALAPDEPNAADQLAYLNLLLGTDVEANATLAKELAEKYPDRLSFRVTAALACLRKHDPGLALAQFKGPDNAPPIQWQQTPPAWRAVYAATLLANEQKDAARDMIATIPRDRLSPEEQALIGETK